MDYEQTLEELKRQLEINSTIEQHAAAQSNSNTELTTRQREVNRELAKNQGELIELRQKNKKLKKQLAWFKGEGKEGDRTGS